MFDRFQELLSRPGATQALTRILDDEERSAERVKDRERAKLRAEREATSEELGLGYTALVCAVKEADREVLSARKALRAAARKKLRAELELNSFRAQQSRKIGRIEVEILRRPISFVSRLRTILSEAKGALGAPPSWAMSKKKYPDMSWYSRAERLHEIERDIDELEELDSEAVVRAEKSIEQRIAAAIR
jgi:hypothetical protein